MIASDVFKRVKSTFGDNSGAQLTDEDLINWINDGQRECVMQIEGLLLTTSYLDLVTGQIRYSLPTDVSTIRAVLAKDYDQGSYYYLTWKSFEELNRLVDGWDGSFYGNSYPSVWTKENNSQITIFPPPQLDTTDGIKLQYSRYPVEVVDGDSTIDLPTYLFNSIVSYVLIQAYEMDEDWEAAQLKASQFQNDLNFNAGRGDWSGQDKYPVISSPDESDYYYDW